MSDKPENPSAFPYPEARDPDGRGIREGAYGMTLRDYFAGQALIGACLSVGEQSDPLAELPEQIAKAVYLVADAMLSERAKS